MLMFSRGAVTLVQAEPTFTPPSPPVAPALGRAFDAECHTHDTRTSDALHAAIIALVERLKRDQVPAERVVLALKSAIAKYGSAHRMPSLIDDPEDRLGEHAAETYRKAFAWCLDAYFGRSDEP
jgi:hypothetical protein